MYTRKFDASGSNSCIAISCEMAADLASPWAGGAIFALTWVLMATRVPFLPIGRTAGTLAGAALTVTANPALSGTAAFSAISLESALQKKNRTMHFSDV
jgi:hypothetical protein